MSDWFKVHRVDFLLRMLNSLHGRVPVQRGGRGCLLKKADQLSAEYKKNKYQLPSLEDLSSLRHRNGSFPGQAATGDRR